MTRFPKASFHHPDLVLRRRGKASSSTTGVRRHREGRMPRPDGRLMHAALNIGDSTVMLAVEIPEWGSLGRGAEGLGR